MSLFTVIPHGPFESKCRKQLSLSSCGWVLILSGQFKITSRIHSCRISKDPVSQATQSGWLMNWFLHGPTHVQAWKAHWKHEARRDTTASEGRRGQLRVSRHNSVRHVNVHWETESAGKVSCAHGHSGAHQIRLSRQRVELVCKKIDIDDPYETAMK